VRARGCRQTFNNFMRCLVQNIDQTDRLTELLQELHEERAFWRRVCMTLLWLFIAFLVTFACMGTRKQISAAVPLQDCCCPITLELMTDPVVAEDGHSYERTAIARWFAEGHQTSPKSREIIGPALLPNHAMRALMSVSENLDPQFCRGTGRVQSRVQTQRDSSGVALESDVLVGWHAANT
jgi:hypothetical protein